MEIGEHGPRGELAVRVVKEERSHELANVIVRHRPMEEQLVSGIHRRPNSVTLSRAPLFVRIFFFSQKQIEN
jgi:hypothetical protein